MQAMDKEEVKQRLAGYLPEIYRDDELPELADSALEEERGYFD